jgi:enoyl-[acyl-carrier protein] reductase III
MSYEGKRALITGGSRGIGRAIALGLAERGCHVAINFLRNRTAAEETRKEIEAHGVECILLKGNISKDEIHDRIFAEYEEQWKRLDFFVSNAVMGVLRPVMEYSPKAWHMTMGTNARAYLFGAQHAAELMEKNPGGAMVALSSLGSFKCIEGYSVLGASKAAIETLTRYFALELGHKGIRVNAVSGSPVKTKALESFPNFDEVVNYTERNTPLGRMGTPEDLGRVAVWLLGEEAAWITGQTIIVDGGLSLT